MMGKLVVALMMNVVKQDAMQDTLPKNILRIIYCIPNACQESFL